MDYILKYSCCQASRYFKVFFYLTLLYFTTHPSKSSAAEGPFSSPLESEEFLSTSPSVSPSPYEVSKERWKISIKRDKASLKPSVEGCVDIYHGTSHRCYEGGGWAKITQKGAEKPINQMQTEPEANDVDIYAENGYNQFIPIYRFTSGFCI
jgi:hypothetical protein